MKLNQPSLPVFLVFTATFLRCSLPNQVTAAAKWTALGIDIPCLILEDQVWAPHNLHLLTWYQSWNQQNI